MGALMHLEPTIPWKLAVAVWFAMAIGPSAAQGTDTSSCKNYCIIDMDGDTGSGGPMKRPALGVWFDPNKPPSNAFEWPNRYTSTKTLVTVINTVLHTTSISTKFPDDYIPPLTNEDGTRIEAMVYNRFGTTYTSTVTFPTPFVAWPEYYVWSGTMGITSAANPGKPATTLCQAASSPFETVPIVSNPQPTLTNEDHLSKILFHGGLHQTDLANNPKGTGYTFMLDWDPGDWWQFRYFRDLFPDQPQLGACEDYSRGPNWGQFNQTAWMVTGSTMLVGETASPVAARSSSSVPTKTAPRNGPPSRDSTTAKQDAARASTTGTGGGGATTSSPKSQSQTTSASGAAGVVTPFPQGLVTSVAGLGYLLLLVVLL